MHSVPPAELMLWPAVTTQLNGTTNDRDGPFDHAAVRIHERGGVPPRVVALSTSGVLRSPRSRTCGEGLNHCEEGVDHCEEGVNHCEEGMNPCEEGVNHGEEGVNHCKEGVNHCEEGSHTCWRRRRRGRRGAGWCTPSSQVRGAAEPAPHRGPPLLIVGQAQAPAALARTP